MHVHGVVTLDDGVPVESFNVNMDVACVPVAKVFDAGFHSAPSFDVCFAYRNCGGMPSVESVIPPKPRCETNRIC